MKLLLAQYRWYCIVVALLQWGMFKYIEYVWVTGIGIGIGMVAIGHSLFQMT